jgi:hypothetical protein
MKQCPRCYRWHASSDTRVCEACWEEIGQMQFWADADDDVTADQFDEDDYEPPIDTVFDREEEARGWQ